MLTIPSLQPLYQNFGQLQALSSALDTVYDSARPMSFNPDYNIEQISKNNYCIRISLSGFKISELDIMLENNILLIKSNEKYNQDDSGKNSILHQGIYKTSFEMRFKLADNVKVSNAVLTDGILHINLEQEIPESKKVHKITISNKDSDIEIAS